MPDYKAMYYALAAQVSNAIELLIMAQQSGEDAAIEEDRILEFILPPDKSDDYND